MIGVAVIGTGAIAKSHIKAYKSFPERCEVRVLCDLYPEKGERLAGELSISPEILKDYREVLTRSEIELVSICLPPSLHAEVSIAASAAGKHVLVEKPMASSLQECDAMIAAANRAGRLLSVVAQNRFKTPMKRLKALLDSGAAGKVLHTTVDSLWWRGESYYDLWWRGTWEREGGGCTLNHAVHHVDLLLWMLGMPGEVSSFFANLNHVNSETEDFSTSVLKYSDGSIAQLTASLVHHGEEQQMTFQTEKARLSIPWQVSASVEMNNGFPQPCIETAEELRRLYEAQLPLKYEGHTGQVENLLSAIENGGRPFIDGEAGRRTLELIMGIYKSALTGETVYFPLLEKDPMYTKETMIAQMPRFHEKTKSIDNFSNTDITLGRDVGK